MEKLTVGIVIEGIALIASLIGGMTVISKAVTKRIDIIFTEKLKPLTKQVNRIDEDATKNFIVRCLNDIEKGETLNTTTYERLHEAYDHYTNDLKLNSYIHVKWHDLLEKGANND